MTKIFIGLILGSIIFLFQNCSREKLMSSLDSTSENSSSVMRVSSANNLNSTFSLGIGEPILSNTIEMGWDADQQIDAIIQLKPKSVRMWMWIQYILLDPTRLNTNYISRVHHIVDRLTAAGIIVIGMDSIYPNWMTGASTHTNNAWNAIPCRNQTAGSAYQNFLNNFERSWSTMSAEFPSIKMWEAGNESNNDAMLLPLQVGPGSCGKKTFSFEEKAAITVDLMYRSHRAIHRANTQATVFMPAPAPLDSQNNVNLLGVRDFIALFYTNIKSGNFPSQNPRDYFDGANWHPYIWQEPTVENWVNPNNDIYAVLKQNGDQDIPILFSEYGNTNAQVDPATAAVWMQKSLELAREHFYWLDYMIWFRAFNDPHAASWGGQGEVNFGIMNDSSLQFSWKPSATVFCQFNFCQAPAVKDPPPKDPPPPPPPKECTPLVFNGGEVSASEVAANDYYFMTCDYGKVLSTIFPNTVGSQCEFIGFSGTRAQFKCLATATSGTISNSCSVNASLSENHCSQKNMIAPIHIKSEVEITATASAQATSATGPNNTLLGNPTLVWSSGGFAPQWIEFDLGVNKTISSLKLTVVQSPNGNTVHQIFAGPNSSPTALVASVAEVTSDGQILTVTFSEPISNIRYIRILTVTSNSWVAWGPIQFSLN